jgi:hypothetical protein
MVINSGSDCLTVEPLVRAQGNFAATFRSALGHTNLPHLLQNRYQEFFPWHLGGSSIRRLYHHLAERSPSVEIRLHIKWSGGKVALSLLTGPGGPQSCETPKLPYFLDNWLTDGAEDVGLTRRLSFIGFFN